MHQRTQTSAVIVVVAWLWTWIGIATTASAGPIAVPHGWAEGSAAAAQAQRDAERWASAWQGAIEQLMSTPADDDFAEMVVLLDIATPLPTAVLADRTAAHEWIESRMRLAMGTSATITDGSLELLPQATPGVAIVRARVELDGAVALVAVGPTGPHHRALVLQYAKGEDLLYADMFEDAIGGLGELRAPVSPFPLGTVRLVALAGWLLLGIIVGIAWTRRCLPRPGARVAGRQVAAGLMGATVLVMGIAGVSLGRAKVELALADTTPWGFAIELAIGGAIAAVVVIGFTELWERRLTPVASAPQQGSFAAHRRGGSSTSLPAIRLPHDPAAASGSYPRPLPGVATGPATPGPAAVPLSAAPSIPLPSLDPAAPGPASPPFPPPSPDERVRPRLAISLDETNPRAPTPTAPGVRRPTRPGIEDGPASLTDPHEPSHPALDGPLPPRHRG